MLSKMYREGKIKHESKKEREIQETDQAGSHKPKFKQKGDGVT